MLPIWAATTAYVVGTRVTPVVPDGTVWWVETAGTSGAAQPTWPTTQPWTVTDGTVVWGRATSFRMTLVAGAYAQLGAFMVANPKLLLQRLTARPRSASTTAKPYAYIGSRPELIATGGQIRQRAASVQIVLVDNTPDNEEALTRMDELVDGLVDWFTKYFHAAGAPTISGAVATDPIPEEEAGQGLYSEVLTVSFGLAEGRQ